MNKLFFLLTLIFAFNAWSNPTTPTGIVLDKEWKVKLNEFAVKHVVHQSWGYPHAERNFHNTLMLARAEKIEVDEDILMAAAFLHDLGGLPPYELEGVDHGVRSAEIGIPLLISWGFPESKTELVKEIIIGHVYYGPQPAHPVARLFRDADILDFLGAIGISRILAANLELGSKPAIENSIKTLVKLMEKLPPELASKTAKAEAKKRVKEMMSFVKTLKTYTFNDKAI